MSSERKFPPPLAADTPLNWLPQAGQDHEKTSGATRPRAHVAASGRGQCSRLRLIGLADCIVLEVPIAVGMLHSESRFGPLPADFFLTNLLRSVKKTFRPSRSRVLSLATCSALAALPLVAGPQGARAATYTVSESSWGTSGTVNSFAWALAQANGNLGHDTISITPVWRSTSMAPRLERGAG